MGKIGGFAIWSYFEEEISEVLLGDAAYVVGVLFVKEGW